MVSRRLSQLVWIVGCAVTGWTVGRDVAGAGVAVAVAVTAVVVAGLVTLTAGEALQADSRNRTVMKIMALRYTAGSLLARATPPVKWTFPIMT